MGNGGPDDNDAQAGRLIVGALTSTTGQLDDADSTRLVAHSLTSEGHDASEDGTGRGTPLVAAPLTKGSATGERVNAPGRRQEDDVNIVPYTFDWQMGGSWSEGGKPSRSWIQDTPGRARSLVKNKTLAVHEATGVRRLTPIECERLQGLPDDWTRLNEDTPDSRRYSALGDAVTANVAEWIGGRILEHARASDRPAA
jgi:DNA (cytosine-5)-methyltransferase 1